MKLKELLQWAEDQGIYLSKVSLQENMSCSWEYDQGRLCIQDAHYFLEADFYCGSHAREILLDLKENQPS